MPVLTEGGACMPPASIPMNSLIKAQVGQKKTSNIKVKKLFLIYNPHGGRKQSKRLAEEVVIPLFKNAGIQTTVIETKYAGHAKG